MSTIVRVLASSWGTLKASRHGSAWSFSWPCVSGSPGFGTGGSACGFGATMLRHCSFSLPSDPQAKGPLPSVESLRLIALPALTGPMLPCTCQGLRMSVPMRFRDWLALIMASLSPIIYLKCQEHFHPFEQLGITALTHPPYRLSLRITGHLDSLTVFVAFTCAK